MSLDTLSLLPEEGPARKLLEKKKPILAESGGAVPVDYETAMVVFGRASLLTDVQEAYCQLMLEDGKPEFTIEQTSSNTYFYINRKGERTDIVEVVRRQTSDTTFDIVYYSAGGRFFGDYQAVIHVQIAGAGEQQSAYTASVYAYPENAFSRFFARHLGLVERFFHKKTEEMTGMITRITCSLCEETKGATVAEDDVADADAVSASG